MRTTTIDDLVKYVLPKAENCPQLVARRAISDTILDLCSKTGCLTTTTCFTTSEGVGSYEINMPDGLEVDFVREVFIDGVKVEGVPFTDLYKDTDFDVTESVGEPRVYCFVRPGNIQFVPRPDSSRFVKIIVASTISRGSSTVPYEFFQDYLEVVVNGALARIHEIAGQTYTNARASAEYALKYRAGVLEIKSLALKGFHTTRGKVRNTRGKSWAL